MKNLVSTILLIIISIHSIYAQKQGLKKANAYYNKYEYINAQETYLKVANKGYQSINLFKNLGDSYYLVGELEQALPWYQKLIDLYGDKVDAEYYFKISQCLKASARYADADKYLNMFVALNSSDTRAQLFERNPNYYEKIENQSNRYKINVSDINSRFSDFGTSFYDDKIVFSSSRDTFSTNKKISQWNKEPFLDLYQAEIDSTLKNFGKPKKLGKNINFKLHESTAIFTKDGKTMYFTRNARVRSKMKSGKRERVNRLMIYKSKMDDEGNWSEAVKLPFNSIKYSVAHPALNQEEDELYFSSDMPGSLGQSDIFKVKINEDGSFSEPINLESPINTEGKETFPFIEGVDQLYFSSDGHMGLGGLDVFVTSLNPKNRYEALVINVGMPVNSQADDFAYILKNGTNMGFFSSNREGGFGKDDIYDLIEVEELRGFTEITGTIVSQEYPTGLPNTIVSIYDVQYELVETKVTDDNGVFSFKVLNSENYFIKLENNPDYESQDKYIPLQELTKSTTNLKELVMYKKIQSAGVGDDLGKILNLQPIYFDLDTAKIREDAEVELARVIEIMLQYPEMKIDVRSHTDSRSSYWYNLKLSERRAKSTIDFIVKKGGIDRKRLTGKGYGERQLINKCANGVPCTKQEHELNRRSEFIIID